ncbi:hypothetical protein RND71_012447 [Anisodus tanguticus]|uniref:Uncharacterized protein n=1 Tax=Anisodus tanguticus TaxID=243964 RepID=A0AAE1SEM9_9SOLA|nr:hypothetical protein RND71_012447 [Anisodus tanguticus]
MQSYKSNADNSTFNGTLNAGTTSTANVPRDGSTTMSMVDSIMSQIQELQAAYKKLGHSYCAPFSTNAGSGERMADVLLELIDCMKKVNAGLEVDFFIQGLSCISTSPPSQHVLRTRSTAAYACHIYHVNYIKKWSQLETSCPICKRDALAILT